MKLNIYFIHAQWLKDRERVITEFQKLITKYTFKNIKTVKVRVITDYDPNEINAEIIGKTVNYEPIKNDEKLGFYNGMMKNLHIFQLSNALKHYKALEEISKNSNDDDINIILEDDILYEDKVCMMIEKLIADLPEKYNIMFLSLPNNLDEARKKQGIKHQNTNELFRVLPYCDSYMVSKEAATILYDNYLPIKYINNIQLSYVIEKIKLQTLIVLPNIFMDGSKYGLFLSVLNPNNVLLFNNDYMKLKSLILKPELNNEEKKEIMKIFETSMIANNPDMMHLKALYNINQKKYKEAESIFENALKVYQAYNCVVNHESSFLKDYIRLYKHLQ